MPPVPLRTRAIIAKPPGISYQGIPGKVAVQVISEVGVDRIVAAPDGDGPGVLLWGELGPGGNGKFIRLTHYVMRHPVMTAQAIFRALRVEFLANAPPRHLQYGQVDAS